MVAHGVEQPGLCVQQLLARLQPLAVVPLALLSLLPLLAGHASISVYRLPRLLHRLLPPLLLLLLLLLAYSDALEHGLLLLQPTLELRLLLELIGRLGPQHLELGRHQLVGHSPQRVIQRRATQLPRPLLLPPRRLLWEHPFGGGVDEGGDRLVHLDLDVVDVEVVDDRGDPPRHGCQLVEHFAQLGHPRRPWRPILAPLHAAAAKHLCPPLSQLLLRVHEHLAHVLPLERLRDVARSALALVGAHIGHQEALLDDELDEAQHETHLLEALRDARDALSQVLVHGLDHDHQPQQLGGVVAHAVAGVAVLGMIAVIRLG